MRDLFFIAFFAVILLVAFRKPFIAIAIWLWSGIFVPVYWLYGFAESIRYNLIFSALAILSYLVFYKRKTFNANLLFSLVILFFLHTTLTTSMTIANTTITWIEWEHFMKVILLFFFVCLVFKSKVQFELLIWMMILSIGFFGLVEGLKFIKSGGVHQVHGPDGHILADNNHLATAMLMIIPLIVYLIGQTKEKWLRLGLIGLVVICVLAVLGTKSRGGFLGLLCVGAYFWTKANRKILMLVIFGLFTYAASCLLSDSWFNRMETIQTMEEDSSFMSRVLSWKMHTLMAMERPMLGGGFKATQYGHVWRSLIPNFNQLDFIPSSDPKAKAWAAHSIYFQVLGDHGFAGLALYLSLIAGAFLNLSAIEKYFKGHWHEKLATMLKVSLASYCIAGAAVSLSYFELFYVVLALICCLSFMKKKDIEAKKAKLHLLKPATKS